MEGNGKAVRLAAFGHVTIGNLVLYSISALCSISKGREKEKNPKSY